MRSLRHHAVLCESSDFTFVFTFRYLQLIHLAVNLFNEAHDLVEKVVGLVETWPSKFHHGLTMKVKHMQQRIKTYQ